MKPKNMSTPSEMVISAVHSLGEKNGSSPQDIVRFISGKYKAESTELKPHIQAALKRCVAFGLLTHESGLYRLKEVNETPAQIIPIVPLQRARRRKRQQKQIKKRRSSKKRARRKKGKSKKSSKKSKVVFRRICTTPLIKRKKIGKHPGRIKKNTKGLRKRKNSNKKNLRTKEKGKNRNVSLGESSGNASKGKEMDVDENNNEA